MTRIVLSAAACAAWMVAAAAAPAAPPAPSAPPAARPAALVLAQATPAELRARRLLNRSFSDPALPGQERERRYLNPQPPQVLQPPDPLARQEREFRDAVRDPAARLGLPPNPTFTDPAPPPSSPLALPPEMGPVDRNSDGAISRSEYFRGRNRSVPAGPAGELRQQRLFERLDSRFRNADSDRDGYVTPQELQNYGNPRF